MTKEIVNKIDWHPLWDGNVTSPQIFSNGQKVFLLYRVATFDEKTISTFKKLNHEGGDWGFLTLVEFNYPTFRLCQINDEVWQGLSYYSQGVGPAQTIENSRWIEEIKQIHKIHPYFDETRWKDLKHYVFLFKE